MWSLTWLAHGHLWAQTTSRLWWREVSTRLPQHSSALFLTSLCNLESLEIPPQMRSGQQRYRMIQLLRAIRREPLFSRRQDPTLEQRNSSLTIRTMPIWIAWALLHLARSCRVWTCWTRFIIPLPAFLGVCRKQSIQPKGRLGSHRITLV